MTIYKDIYPETILNIINNENFNNIELDSPMIKPEVIAKALNITFDEKLTVDFDSASRSIKPSLYDDFLANPAITPRRRIARTCIRASH